MMHTTLSVNINCNVRDGHATIHRPERLTNKEDLRGDPKTSWEIDLKMI